MVRASNLEPLSLFPTRNGQIEPGRTGLPRVQFRVASAPVLKSGPWPDRPDVLSLNVSQGCPTQAIGAGPGGKSDVIWLSNNLLGRLDAELTDRRPKAVFLSPGCDPFAPLAEVQSATGRVVELLARRGVEAWLMTRGAIRPGVMRILSDHAESVRVTVGLSTLDRGLRRVLEPLSAPVRTRLREIHDLRRAKIPVQVALQPLVPGVTDTKPHLASLLEAVAAVGVKHVTAGYLYLRPADEDTFFRAMEQFGLDAIIRTAYQDGTLLRPDANTPTSRFLSRSRRQRGYAALMSLASGLGITVKLDSLSNPDFRLPSAAVLTPGGGLDDTKIRLRQLVLPLAHGGFGEMPGRTGRAKVTGP